MARRARHDPGRRLACSFCGEAVRRDAASCPHCGSDRATGWGGHEDDAELELPEAMDDRAYQELVAGDPELARAAGPSDAVLRRRRRAFYAIVLALLFLVAAVVARAQDDAGPWPPWTVEAAQVRPAADAGAGPLLDDAEWVLGLEEGGAARAWPLTLVAAHEVLNDVVGGVAVAVAWCVSCQAPVAYRRELDRRTLELGNTRDFWQSSAILYDTQTQSRWILSSGAAHSGPLEGRSLTALPIVVAAWGDWRRDHPATTVVIAEHARSPQRERLFLFEERGLDALGLVVRHGDAVRLVPLREVQQRTLVEVALGEATVAVVFSREHRLLRAWTTQGAPLELRRDAQGRPSELVERDGARRFDVDTGAAIGADDAPPPPPLRRAVAFPLRKGRFRAHFPEGGAPPGK